jgi:1-acyl-sn-glycerol-3-phosphate acyltransferase
MRESRTSIGKEVDDRLSRLELSFNERGYDPFGVSRQALAPGMRALGWLYRHYFTVSCQGLEHIPHRGRAILVGNHSGGFAVDAGMVLAACFFELEPPRLAHGMADRFINRLPFFSQMANRTGQITGSQQHARKLLADERLLLVFPEGTRGTAKLFWNRYTLTRFTAGFARLALSTNTPIVPFAFFGGGEAVPTISNLTLLGKLVGLPYVPLTPYLLPLPLPVKVEIHFGKALHLTGTGNERSEDINVQVERVKTAIAALITRHRPATATGFASKPSSRAEGRNR